MSNWTHVAGIIRMDDIRMGNSLPDFDELIGKECLFADPTEVWKDSAAHPEKYLPMGSEGSLQKAVWVNPWKSSMAAYAISIFGDLRDHDDPQEIIDWFREKCSGLWVRNAVITVENELNGSLTWEISHREDIWMYPKTLEKKSKELMKI